ncbi:MAG: ATP-binding protein, partial [Actinomycetota bacterium]
DPLADPSLREMGQSLNLIAVRADGSRAPVEVTLSLVGTEDGLWVIAAIRDATERRRAEEAMAAKEEAIREARDAALEASRLKSQFLATMSHEIRTPMNGVLGLTHLLLKSDVDDQQRRYLLSLRDSAENLLQILNDILDFSKAEAGKLGLESVDFDLRRELRGVTDLFGSSALEKGLELSVWVSTEVPRLVGGDPVRLRQILTNLIGNAVKFTDRGAVRLSVRAAGAGIRFEVSDTGIGIDPAARPHLLEPFTQADASTTRRFGGTGLGLAICRQLIDLMGGAIDFQSTPGMGSRFWFEVPLAARGRPSRDGALPGAEPVQAPGPAPSPDTAPAPLPATAPATASAPVPATASAPVPATDRAPVPAPVRVLPTGTDRASVSQATTEAPADAGGPRVLVVDDSALNQLVAKGLLEALGYLVDLAGGGSEAVEAVARADYDLILMDCLMPAMDGFEATAEIRALEPPGQRTPIVALTAAAMDGDWERCLAAGMDGYVTKPIAPQVLASVAARYCRSAG